MVSIWNIPLKAHMLKAWLLADGVCGSDWVTRALISSMGFIALLRGCLYLVGGPAGGCRSLTGGEYLHQLPLVFLFPE